MSYPRELWPWSGHFTVTIAVSSSAHDFTGDVSGQISLTISSPMVGFGVCMQRYYSVPPTEL